MLITGLSFDKFSEIVESVSKDEYEGNLIVHPDYTIYTDNRFRARTRTVNSREAGSRRSWSGRRIPSACWHTTRDVLLLVFAEFPNARVQTSMATYRGEADFFDKFPRTADMNIGSMVAPAYMPDLCDCEY